MIIRLGLMDKDEQYIVRLADYFNTHMGEDTTFEISLFSGLDDYEAFRRNGGQLDILLASPEVLEDPERVEAQTVLAYLSEDMTMVSYKGCDAICKYQKAFHIGRAVQGLAAKARKDGGKYALGGNGRILLFFGAAGGMGSTTAAIGCAVRLAHLGRRVVYLNYQQSWYPDSYFDGGGASLSDVHYTFQEWQRLENDGDDGSVHRLQLRLKSLLTRDGATGVEYYNCFTLPADGLDMSVEEITEQLKALAGQYDDCIVDMDGRLCDELLAVLKISAWSVIVSDGSEKGNFCLDRTVKSLKALNDGGESLLSREIGALYTKFGSEARVDESLPGFVRVLGRIPFYRGASSKAIVRDLANCSTYRMLESGD